MITKQELQEAIAECQGVRNPNANTCLKLASYYTILDHTEKEEQEQEIPAYSFASASTSRYESDTDFGNAIKDKDLDCVMEILDELMTTLQVLNPRLYNGVLRRISNCDKM